MLTGSCLCTINKYVTANVDAAIAMKPEDSYFWKIVDRILFFAFGATKPFFHSIQTTSLDHKISLNHSVGNDLSCSQGSYEASSTFRHEKQ